MSRIGKNPVSIPDGVDVKIVGQDVSVKGKLGELSLCVHDDVVAVLEKDDDGKNIVRLSPKDGSVFAKKIWPTMRTLTANLIEGVTKGYSKKLELHGVGYRANMQGNDVVMSLGFSHEVRYQVPKGVKIEIDKQTLMTISGIDKRLIGQTAAEIRAFKPPEPYKGKGIRYADEYILRKEGKKK